MMESRTTNVLLIEDNPGDADLVRLRLVEGHSSVKVNCVHRLSEALASLAKEQPSLVLLDLNLPDSHGADTFRKVLEKAPGVPVVVISGQDDEALAIKAMNQGVQDYLIKGDITSKHLERAIRYAVERQGLQRSIEMAQKKQLEFKNQFLSHVSHELRTPLTCIHQYTTLLADGLAGPVAPEQADHLKTILKSVNQLHAMIRDLLEATRAETGKLRVEPRCIAIAGLVQQAIAMMRPTAAEKHIGLEAGIDERIPLIYADPDRILEVLINLIDNGIKFTPPDGSVVVQACMTETDPSYVYFSVSDTGRGIRPDAKRLIFERLFQDPDSVDNNRAGLGLGLFICREIVRLHDGRIWVSSEPEQGSTFTFTLPIYSLAKLLFPVVTHEDRLRPAFVLVRVELKPLTHPPQGNWREVWQQCLDTLRHCVYLDKDLVLPPMGSPGTDETFFVVASTDLKRSEGMTTRIRVQLGKVAGLQSKATLEVKAMPIEIPAAESGGAFPGGTLQEQVERLADRVTEMVLGSIEMQKHAARGNGKATQSAIHKGEVQ
jgi:two-component system, sensor histidine kinase